MNTQEHDEMVRDSYEKMFEAMSEGKKGERVRGMTHLFHLLENFLPTKRPKLIQMRDALQGKVPRRIIHRINQMIEDASPN